MEGLGTLLLFAALFYFMMRFGCGAHAVHGHGGGHAGHGGGHVAQDGGVPARAHDRHGGHTSGTQGTLAATERDPVCGMTVEDGQGYAAHHAGRAYRLCSRACLDKFEANPDQFAAQGGVR